MSSSLLPPLGTEQATQNGQRAPVNYIRENRLGQKSKVNASRRAGSLARGSGPPLADGSVAASQGIYRGNFSFQQALR